jgi:cupin 2 domain-containing protein
MFTYDRCMRATAGVTMSANLFDGLPTALPEEQFVALLERPGVTIERIVSTGQSSPPGFWYDQPRGEWVVVLAGEARLRFEDEPLARELKPGDYVDIAPHRRHRVEWTRPDVPTIWLAVRYG